MTDGHEKPQVTSRLQGGLYVPSLTIKVLGTRWTGRAKRQTRSRNGQADLRERRGQTGRRSGQAVRADPTDCLNHGLKGNTLPLEIMD
ncbi:hypothetical protein ACOMHN_009093 [Nucella lapillus]